MEVKKHVLVVDDEAANIFMLEGILSGEGFEVSTAQDGLECLEKLRQDNNKTDLVLLDIMMPEMSGIDVLKRMKDHSKLKEIPVIMVSALADGDNIEKALSLGAIEYIKKPVDELELLARIDTVLKLKEQENKLKDSLNIKDDFIRMIAHDLRTPFSTISGYADILLQEESLTGKLNDEQIDSLKFIRNSSYFVIDYFNKMLAWSNIGHRNLVLDIENVNIHQLVENIYMTFKPMIKEKEINFKINIDNIDIQADKTYLGHAITNLVSNAVKFTPKGGKISIYSIIEDSDNILCIKDSGEGVAQEKKTLFNSPYVKSTPGTNGEKGTGTGLYICRKVMEAHGFDIDFESVQGKGTTFKLFLNKKN